MITEINARNESYFEPMIGYKVRKLRKNCAGVLQSWIGRWSHVAINTLAHKKVPDGSNASFLFGDALFVVVPAH